MSEKKAYEQIISSKLDSLPPPDMAGAIWSRIEAQLDIDLPTDGDNNDPGPGKNSPSGWIGGAGMILFVAAFISIFLMTKNKQTKAPVTQPVENVQNTSPGITRDSISKNTRPGQSLKTETVTVPKITSTNNDTNTFSEEPILATPYVNSDTLQATGFAPSLQQPMDTILPKKRQRGVTGLNDDDYRIVPVK
jgi:hypothetical protein